MLCVPVNEDIKPLKMYQMVVLKKQKKTSFNHNRKAHMHAAFILKTSVEYYWHINWNCSRWMNEMNKAGQGNCPAGK